MSRTPAPPATTPPAAERPAAPAPPARIPETKQPAADTAKPAAPAPAVKPPPAKPEPTKPRRRNPVPVLAGLTILFFVSTVLFGLMALFPRSAPIRTSTIERAAATDTEQEISEVAGRFAENLLTYNSGSVDADMDRALRDATPDFSERRQGALPGGTIESYKAQIREARGTSSADVKGTTVTSRDGDTSTVLVVMQRTHDSTRRDRPEIGLYVLELTLVNTSDGWKVNDAANPATAN